MKTKAELEQNILSITLELNKKFPELVNEIPLKVSNNEDENIKKLEEHYNSLRELYTNYSKSQSEQKLKNNAGSLKLSGYPQYPPSEDIYYKATKEMDIDPEDISKKKAPNEKKDTLNEKSFDDDMSGNDLDVPGSELDDQQKSIGSEDEENNYYSLGGDNHTDLEEK